MIKKKMNHVIKVDRGIFNRSIIHFRFNGLHLTQATVQALRPRVDNDSVPYCGQYLMLIM